MSTVAEYGPARDRKRARRLGYWVGCATILVPFIPRITRLLMHIQANSRRDELWALVSISGVLSGAACALCIWTFLKIFGKRVGWLPVGLVWLGAILNGFVLLVLAAAMLLSLAR